MRRTEQPGAFSTPLQYAHLLGVALGLLWLGAWLLNVALGPFTPLVTAVVIATLVLLVLRRDGD